MNVYLFIILAVLIGDYILDLIVDYLNVTHIKTDLIEEFKGYYDVDKYKKSQNYLKENTYFRIVRNSVHTVIILVFILTGGFNFVDQFARSFNFNFIVTGLIFAGILTLGLQVLSIPFSIYKTFVIEEKYNFNKTTVKTFILDILKSWILGLVIGGIIFSLIIWFFDATGKFAWVYCWTSMTVIQLFLIFISPVVIMPIFNKFTPLKDGELKKTIEDYANKENFKMKGIFTMDGSRRSSKANALFTGIGKYRRIVLLDTLIEKYTVDELVCILAHEMGHYKKNTL